MTAPKLTLPKHQYDAKQYKEMLNTIEEKMKRLRIALHISQNAKCVANTCITNIYLCFLSAYSRETYQTNVKTDVNFNYHLELLIRQFLRTKISLTKAECEESNEILVFISEKYKQQV